MQPAELNVQVKGRGFPSKLMIVGDYPELGENFAFEGKYEVTLREILRINNQDIGDHYVTYLFHDHFHSNILTVEALQAAKDQLWKEIEAIEPNVIVAFGEIVLNVLTEKYGIKNYRGSVLPSTRTYPKVIGIQHPRYLHYVADDLIFVKMKNKDYRIVAKEKKAAPHYHKYVMAADFAKALRHSRNKEFQYLRRNIIIPKDSSEVYQFIKRWKHIPYAATDIETIHCYPATIAISCSKFEALSLPLFQQVFGYPLTKIPHKDLAEIWVMLNEILHTKKIIGQNYKFDEEKLEKLGLRTLDFHADLGMMAHTLDPELPINLGFQTSMQTEEPYYKDEGRDFDPRRDNIRDLLTYGGKDGCVEFELFEILDADLRTLNLDKFYYNHVHPMHKIYREIQDRGIRVDEQAKTELIRKYQAQSAAIQHEIDSILEAFGIPLRKQADKSWSRLNIRSPKQVKDILFEKLGIPNREKTDEDTLFSLIANVLKDPNHIALCNGILDKRKVDKTLGTYLFADPDYDNRMRTQVRITGTETGRTATSILDAPVRPTELGIALQTMTKHGEIGADLRRMFIPDPGFVFLECDLSQAEPRIVALLSEDYDLLKMFDTIDIHSWTAGLCLSIPMESVKKGSGERHIGKQARNGGNYNMRKRRLMIEVNTSARKYAVPGWQDISEKQAGLILEKFHAASPKIKEIFHAQVTEAVEETRTLINPFGRRRRFLGYMGEQLFMEAFAQIPQSTVGDQVKQAMRLAKQEAPELQILCESHDAFLSQVPINNVEQYAKLIKSKLEIPIDFSGCTLSRGVLHPIAECEVGENWLDLKKFKL